MATDNQYLQQQLINQDPYSLLDPESVYRNREALGATTPNIDETLGNIPSSAGQFASDIAGVVTNPVQTIDAIGNLGLGLIALAIPDAYQEESLDKPQEAAMAVGQYFADRYGGIDAAKESLKTDPVGVVADVSAILLGGGYLATRGGLKGGQVATQAGLATDPLIVAGRGVGELAGAVSRRDFMKGAGAGIGSLMLPVTNMLSDIKAPIAAAAKALNPTRFLEKTKAMFDDIAYQKDMWSVRGEQNPRTARYAISNNIDPPWNRELSSLIEQNAARKFDLNRSVKNAPSEVRVNMPKIKKIDDGKFEYDLDLEGTSWLDEDPYYMEKVAHQVELEHFKGSGFAPNELQVLDNLNGALYYTENRKFYESIAPDKADPGSLKTYTPTDSMANKEFGYIVSTYTIDGVPVTRQRLPGNSQQAEFIEYTVPARKAVKNKTGEMQQQKLDLPIDSAPTTAAKDIVQAVDDSMTPTERMNALLKEKMGDAEPDAPRAEPTKAEQRIAELDTQLYDVNNVLDREGGNMSNVNRAKLKEQKQKLTDERKKSFENTEVEVPPSTFVNENLNPEPIYYDGEYYSSLEEIDKMTSSNDKFPKEADGLPITDPYEKLVARSKFRYSNRDPNAVEGLTPAQIRIAELETDRYELRNEIKKVKESDKDKYISSAGWPISDKKVIDKLERSLTKQQKDLDFFKNEYDDLYSTYGSVKESPINKKHFGGKEIKMFKETDFPENLKMENADPGTVQRQWDVELGDKPVSIEMHTYKVDGKPISRSSFGLQEEPIYRVLKTADIVKEPPSTITRRDALKGMGATGIAALMGTGADIADVATTTTKTAKAAKAAKGINPTAFLNRTKDMFESFDDYMEDVLPGDLTDGPTDFYDSVNPVRGVEKGTSSRETITGAYELGESFEIRDMQIFDKVDYITEIEESYFKKAGFKQDDLVKIDSREDLNLFSAYHALDPKNADKGSLKIIDGIEDMDRMELSVKTYTIDGVPISYAGDGYDVYYYIMPSKNALMELAK